MSPFEKDLVAALPFLNRNARAMTRDRSAADDLVSDTVVKALRFQARFQLGTNLYGWLYLIMRRVFLQRFRAPSRQVATDPHSEIFANLNTAPEQESAIYVRELQSLTSHLTPDHRRALHLAADGASIAAAARAQGIEEGTAKSRLSRARRTYARLMEA